MDEGGTGDVGLGVGRLDTTPFVQLLQLQIRMNMLEDKLNGLERSLNLIKLGGTFILLIVSCDYLNDLGWFGTGGRGAPVEWTAAASIRTPSRAAGAADSDRETGSCGLAEKSRPFGPNLPGT